MDLHLAHLVPLLTTQIWRTSAKHQSMGWKFFFHFWNQTQNTHGKLPHNTNKINLGHLPARAHKSTQYKTNNKHYHSRRALSLWFWCASVKIEYDNAFLCLFAFFEYLKWTTAAANRNNREAGISTKSSNSNSIRSGSSGKKYEMKLWQCALANWSSRLSPK